MSYRLRPLTPDDAEVLDTFLSPRTAEAYFLRSNALAGGLTYEGKFLQAEYLGAFHADRLVGVVAYSWINTVLLYADDQNCLPELARALLPLFQNRQGIVESILGLSHQVDIVVRALALPSTAFRQRDGDGLFRLNLENMKLPDVLAQPGFSVRFAEEKDREQLVAWRVAFNIESLNTEPGPALAKKVEKEIGRRLELKDLFILEQNGVPVAFCGAGGYVPEAVMTGPVWTPPVLRGRGYAKAVTAGALKLLARERPKLKWAVLFAVRPDAIGAYEAIGFERFADWQLALVKEDFRVSGAH